MTDLSVNLAPPLRKILDAELARGNRIREISAWPPRCWLMVFLEQPFWQRYETGDDVEYLYLNDPHYWTAEYSYKGGVQVLAY